MAENGNELQLILALAAGASTRKAGEKAGFSERTVQRRLRDDCFCREVARARGRIISRTTAMLARTSLRAVRASTSCWTTRTRRSSGWRHGAYWIRWLAYPPRRRSRSGSHNWNKPCWEKRKMMIKNRLQRLEIAAREIRRRQKEAEKAAEKRRLVRGWVVAAGLRPGCGRLMTSTI